MNDPKRTHQHAIFCWKLKQNTDLVWVTEYRLDSSYFLAFVFQIPSFLFFTEIECTVNNIRSGFMYSSLHLKNWLLPNFRLLFFQIFWIPLNFRLPVYFRLPLKFGLHLNFCLQLNLCLQNIYLWIYIPKPNLTKCNLNKPNLT